MIFNHRAVSLVIFGLLILSSDSTIGGSSNALVSAESLSWGDSLPATAEDLKAKAEFVRLGATFVEGDSLPATAEDLNAKAEFVRLGATFAEAGSAPVVPPIDEITAAAVSLPKDFCYNENGAEVCLYYYDDLTCRVKLDGRSFRTILSASFCASIAAPTSSDPSMGSQPIEHLSLRPSASPIVPPTDEIIVSPPKDFCYIENGSDVCIYYYDDLKCDVKLNGRSFRTGISASFCASLAAPYSSDPSTGIQPTKSPSLRPIESLSSRPTMSPSSQIPLVRAGPTVQLSVDAVLKATEEAEKAEAILMAAEEVQKEAETALKAAEEAQKDAQKSAEAATKATEQAQMEAQKATEKAKAAEVAQMEAEEAQKAAEMAAEEAEKTAEEAQMEAKKAEKVTEEAQKEALKALKATEEAKVEAQKASEKAKAAEKAQKEAEKAAEKAQQEAKHAAVNEGKEDTGVMLEEEEMVFLSLMYNRGDVETDSEIASLAVRQRRGRRRAHTIRRRATATKNRRETMAK